MSVRYLSLCSGIEAASVAWQPLGWQAVAFSEIEPFPCAVLAHHYPDVPNIGDMTKVHDWRQYHGAVDLVVAGTPCQDFSVAGKRAGLAGERSGLALAFTQVLSVVRPEWVVWENVPGVFSTNGGRDFGTFLRALDDIGYSCAWRVLDAQFFRVPQRRRRVFVVGHLGDWRPAAAVLFEREGLRRDTPPSRQTPEDIAGTLEASLGRSRGAGTPPGAITQALTGRMGEGGPDDNKAQGGFYVPEIVRQAISSKWSKGTSGPAGDEHHNLICAPAVSTTITANDARHSADSDCTRTHVVSATFSTSGNGVWRDGPLRAREQDSHENLCLAFTERGRAEGRTLEYLEEQAYCLTNPGSGGRTHSRQIMTPQLQVRRLTPRECERLQGFPDDYTAIPFRGKPAADCPDGPRYKALGNSMAVPVMRWIGGRIAQAMAAQKQNAKNGRNHA